MKISKFDCVIGMANKIVLLCCPLLIYSWTLVAQPSTEIMLADLSLSEGSITNFINITQHPGYDNQPFFTPQGVYYSAQQAAQTEVMLYTNQDEGSKQVTQSPGSEYSPTLMPNGTHFSTIILEADGTQLLWKYQIDGSNPEVLVPDLKIGYHCWLSPTLMAAFVLGDPHKLYLIDLEQDTQTVIAENIGRSLHKIPGTHLLSYVDKSVSPWAIVSYDWKNKTTTRLTDCLPGAEDLAWAPNSTILMGSESKLYRWTKGGAWSLLAELESAGIKGITRLAINAKGDKIALVVAE